jgi:uncharacterized radical SAM protein YgiQ
LFFLFLLQNMSIHTIIPTTKDELKRLGWEYVDIIIVSGDAYVDHPSFGTAVMARLAEYAGARVAVLPQPNWRDDLRDFKKLGEPRLFFGVTAGCMDSMVNHYTAQKRLRSDDAYTPGGKAGFRPDYACTVYTKILQSIYPNTPVLLGGIEASLRRISHYDYWSDAVKPSILVDSGADMILYGMAEKAFMMITKQMLSGKTISQLKNIPQTAFIENEINTYKTDTISLVLPSHEKCVAGKKDFAHMFGMHEKEITKLNCRKIVQAVGSKHIVINPPFPPPSQKETDLSYDLPYTRLPHPKYKSKPPIPAFEMIKNSVTIHRGCFGGCAFCAIHAHQGKFISWRSTNSITNEIKNIVGMPDFKGHITDMGGPSANMYAMEGIDKSQCEKCQRISCLHPYPCANLNMNHRPLINLYKTAASIKGVKLITIGSGIRYDMLVNQVPPHIDKQWGLTDYLEQLVENHISGRLKVAPEHIAEQVLHIMRKPSFDVFKTFHKTFKKINAEKLKKQELVLYLIAGHPGSSEEDMRQLAKQTKAMGYRVETIQEFTPTPGTLSSTIYYTGLHPYSMKPVGVPKSMNNMRQQKDAFFKKKKKR